VVAPGLPISRDGSAGIVSGLGAQVRVFNGSGLDTIHVTGTTAVDTVPLVGTADADTAHTVADGTDVVVDGFLPPGLLVRLTAIETLEVALAGGADTFTAVGNLAALTSINVDGGDGADTILGSNGADTLAGGPGDDFVDGQQGIDTIDLGDGTDVFQWDPGDGSDTIAGGTGADQVLFNGSAGSENFALFPSANGHVTLTRSLAAIIADFVGIETLDLRTFGGNDVVTISDLAGTGMTAVNTDLGLFDGSADTVFDEVIVNGTGSDDTIAVTDDASTVAVAGLAATVRISGADATLDRLTVNGLEGDDTITASPGAGALMVLNLQP
jgi:Ca2+-binding RTX toxin-like protein